MENRRRSLEQFVVMHRDAAVRVAFRLGVSDQAAAEDLVQDAFVRAQSKIESLRDPGEVKAWFYRILVRLAANQRRRQGVRSRHQSSLGLLYPATTDAPCPDPALRERVRDAIDRLTEAQRAVVVLVYLEQFTLDEAAGILGSAPGTVRSHLHRALASMRRDLAAQLEEHR